MCIPMTINPLSADNIRANAPTPQPDHVLFKNGPPPPGTTDTAAINPATGMWWKPGEGKTSDPAATATGYSRLLPYIDMGTVGKLKNTTDQMATSGTVPSIVANQDAGRASARAPAYLGTQQSTANGQFASSNIPGLNGLMYKNG